MNLIKIIRSNQKQNKIVLPERKGYLGRNWNSIRSCQKNNRKRRIALWNFLFGSLNLPGVCYWCEKELKFEDSTFDHCPPLSKGGKIEVGVISCAHCNHCKVGFKVKSLPDYLSAMRIEYEKKHT